MPLDGHNFLVSQGWSGRGTGLRQGAISRPIAIPQKRNLAGLGKDRDEAFPFWDHLFTAASKSIQLKLASDEESDEETSSLPEIKRTATGIISNRRPITGASAATSGTSEQDACDVNPRLNLLTIAKRDAARTRLYARFLRGPILGPDDVFPALPAKPLAGEVKDGQTNPKYIKNDKKTSGDNDNISTSKRKRNPEDVIARAQRKKERKEQKAIEKEERRVLRRERRTNEVTLEDTGEKEKKKRRKLESKKKEEGKGDCADQVLKVKRKRKEKSRKAGLVAADIPRKETILENGLSATIVRSTGMLVPDAAEHTYTDQQPSDGIHERRKKKRKREEV